MADGKDLFESATTHSAGPRGQKRQGGGDRRRDSPPRGERRPYGRGEKERSPPRKRRRDDFDRGSNWYVNLIFCRENSLQKGIEIKGLMTEDLIDAVQALGMFPEIFALKY